MVLAFLKDILNDWSAYELEDSIYLPSGTEPSLDLKVNVLPFDPMRKRVFEGQQYLLGIEQVRDAVEGLKGQLGRAPTLNERLRAIVHFARHDAFIDPRDTLGG
jgi:hypothetical protein